MPKSMSKSQETVWDRTHPSIYKRIPVFIRRKTKLKSHETQSQFLKKINELYRFKCVEVGIDALAHA